MNHKQVNNRKMEIIKIVESRKAFFAVFFDFVIASIVKKKTRPPSKIPKGSILKRATPIFTRMSQKRRL